ncbi:MAG: alpha/beta hydrolase [Candidatus Eremiobacteraeota bacterium]|nr:alpha/beta hydrolase [Candidatus Eremiobacteraeota bacterium]MBC5803755.1 alpha/beta hydrolase [Candidatus Eremiobacteraeota bacterium]MBC5822995.1 alpha/beta hydrolase [Candidatus Eremiobacteraeota bacterium]
MRTSLAAVTLLVAVFALRERAWAECTRAPADGAYFVTDREPVGGDQLFSGERGLTKDRDAIVTRGVISGKDERREQRCSSERAFFAALAQSFTPKDARQVLLYIHGYYTPFRTAIRDGLAIRRGLHFAGPLIVYSWPAKVTSRLAYVKDEANAGWSMARFRRFVASLVERYRNVPLYVASHSLGARFAADGIETIRRGPCPTCFRRAVFFAPDIDADTLHAALADTGLCGGRPPENPKSSAPVTLYVSNKDLALRQSQSLHGFQRAGQAGSELVLCGGVDTIDVGYYKSDDKAGHGYHVEARVLQDARAALEGIAPTNPRRKLTVVARERGRYYELKQ